LNPIHNQSDGTLIIQLKQRNIDTKRVQHERMSEL